MINWNNHHRIIRAEQALHAGGVIAYPSEAVWGLGCDPFSESAVERILALKRRQRSMGLILIAADISQFLPFLRGLPELQLQQLAATWPGPVTWLVPNNGVAPDWITGGRDTLALRVTDHPLALALCRAFASPIVSTSANPHGFPPARDRTKVNSYFRGNIDEVLPGVVGSAGRPTEIRHLITGKIIRA